MAMDRSEWERIITRFQACARGHLARTEVRRAREDFEEIVQEIEGGLTHLRWTDTTLSTPLFTDTGGECPGPTRGSVKPPDKEIEASPPQRADPPSEDGQEKSCVQRDRRKADRQEWSSIPVREEGEEQGWADDGVAMESTARSSVIWSRAEQDINAHPQKGSKEHRLVQEVPRTPESLRLHRNTMTMELVWLQQAINSRKKYLLLKDRLPNVGQLAPDSL